MIRKLFTLSLIGLGLATAACNTVAGAGRDVSSAGDAVSDAANSAR